MKRTYLRLTLLTLSGALLLPGCAKKEAAPPPAPPEVLVTKVVKEDVPIFAEAIATLNGSTNTQINAQVSGYLIKQAYIEGQYVKKGDLLFQIDPKPFQAALAQAQANLVTAQAQLKKSQEDLTRYKALVQSGAVSQQEYQNEVQVVNGAQGNVDASAAAVTTAQINLGYATINAPIDGIAGKANPNVGDLIQPNTVMTTMSTVDPIQVQFTVSESFYMQNQARINQISDMPMANRPYGLQMIMPNGSVYPHKGQFYYLDRQVNNNTGTFNVYALFPNPERILRPGQFVRVRGVAEQINGAIVIPQRAIAELQGLNQVYVVQDDNTINVVNVQVGDTHGSLQVITSGLTEGQTIVVEGIQKCQQGTKVDPKPWQEPKAADIAPNTNAPPTAPATNTLVEPAKP